MLCYRRTQEELTICVLALRGKPETGIPSRIFPLTVTGDLKQLRTWLKNCQVIEIAMELTGQVLALEVESTRRPL